MPEPRISVVIPVLNEGARVDGMVEALKHHACHEVLVVDGGSADGTWARLDAKPDVQVFGSARGRAIQMNIGAAHATGEVILFLHADVTLPDNAVALIREGLADEAVVAGAFWTRTLTDHSIGRGRWLGPLLRIADVRSHYTRLPYGDQAIFVRREVFEAVGGYPEVALMEDIALSRRLSRVGEMVTLRAAVSVSGRRFQTYPLRSFVAMNIIPPLYWLGVPTRWLRRLYPDVR